MYTNNKLFQFALLLLTSLILSSCNGGLAGFGLEGADGPIDDPLYEGVYVTIDAIKINGKEIDDFERQTINFAQLTNGLTQELCNTEVSEGTYDKLTIVLDFDKDQQGEAPGCYINTVYDRKIDLANGRSGKEEIEIAKDFELKEGEDTRFILDFDLRKSVRNNIPGDEKEVNFVSNEGIKDAIRIVEASKTGDVKVNLSLEEGVGETMLQYVLYLYPRGTFEKTTEMIDSDGDGIVFEKALTSGKMNFNSVQGNEFAVLSFIPEGDYDLIIEAYERYEFSSFRGGFLVVRGQETPVIPLSIANGQTTELTFTGIQVIQ